MERSFEKTGCPTLLQTLSRQSKKLKHYQSRGRRVGESGWRTVVQREQGLSIREPQGEGAQCESVDSYPCILYIQYIVQMLLRQKYIVDTLHLTPFLTEHNNSVVDSGPYVFSIGDGSRFSTAPKCKSEVVAVAKGRACVQDWNPT